MDLKNIIGIGVSSALIELKAELLRKKNEVGASSCSSGTRPSRKSTSFLNKPSNKSITSNKNPGVDKRAEKDLETHKLEEKSLEKSKAMLVAKAEIYDNLKRNALDYDEKEHPILASSLVDFQKKALENRREEIKKVESRQNDLRTSGDYEVNEDEWTEFTDALGRTRRCLKTDLASFSNEEFSRPIITSPEEEARLKMHEKWEGDMEKLSEKSEVHYQDIRFDEVRAHGVSYYEFSKDNQIREEQIRGLKKMSEQTELDRSKAAQVQLERKLLIKERLKKVRQRKRAKLGLPPEENKSESSDKEANIETKEEPSEILPEADAELPIPMRAWDFGKPGVFGPKPTSFDELDAKWLKDRRADRNSEFAPPSAYSNFVKSKEPYPGSNRNQRSYEPLQTSLPQVSKRIADELPAPKIEQLKRGKGAEIAPPPTFEYYHGGNTSGNQPRRMEKYDDTSVSDAIAAGLKVIREQAERQAKNIGKPFM